MNKREKYLAEPAEGDLSESFGGTRIIALGHWGVTDMF